MKIYLKLMGILVAVLLGVGLVTGYFIMSQTQDAVRQNIETNALYNAKITSVNLYSHIKEKKEDLDSFALPGRDNLTGCFHFHVFEGIALFDEKNIVYSQGALDFKYFYDALLESGKNYAAKDGYLIMYSEVKEGRGVLGITKIGNWFDNKTKDYTVYIFDTQGRIVWHPDPARIGQKKSGSIIIDKKEIPFQEFLKSGKDGVGLHVDEQSMEALAYVPEVNWVVEFSQPLNSYRGVKTVRDIFFMMSAITLLCILLSSSFLIRKELEPLNLLSTSLKNFEKGEFKEIKTDGSDEIRELSHSFNNMAKSITAAMDKQKQANKEMENFTYTISHDLKAPLISLQGFSSLLSEGYKDRLDEKGNHYLSRIQSNIDTMEKLIKDLLELSRIERRTEMMETPSYELIKNALQTLEYELKARNIKISLKDGFPVIRCNPDNIFQVFLNLLDNAVKYGASEIEIGWAPMPGKVKFYVKDNGTGIEKEYLQKIWHMKEIKSKNGTGLGLGIVKKAVKAHGGNVWVKSEKGKGSEFGFSIPVRAL